MKARLRSPSLFWTFAGSFLAALVAVAVLQALVMILVLRPVTSHWKKTRAELLTRQVALQLSESPGPLSDEDIRAVLRSHHSEESAEQLIYVGDDGRVIGDRHLPPRMAGRVGDWMRGDPEAPAGKPVERPRREDSPGPGWLRERPDGEGRRPEVLNRQDVELASGETGEIIVLARRQRFLLWPHDLPRPLLLALPIAVLVAGAAGLIMFRVFLRRLGVLEDLATRVTGGDLGARIPNPGSDEIGRLGERLNRMTESLSEAMRRVEESDAGRRRLLADISHELATPLTSIRGYAETLLDPSVPLSDEERVDYLKNVLEESERMDLLIGDLLDLTRLEARAVTLSMDRLDLTELSRNVMNRLENRFRQAGLSVKWLGKKEEAWVSADGRHIEQVIENLLVNALRYVPSGGEVTLSIGRVAASVNNGDPTDVGGDTGEKSHATEVEKYRITISDDGPGFPAGDLHHVFDRFYRADAARPTGGTGLGLAIVKEIVKLHGGEVRAENRQPSGASIHVDLPAAS
jgi:signal transduction histidine kinase